MIESDTNLNKNSQLSLRILEYIESKHITVAKFERLCGLSNGYVSKIKGSISDKKLNDILNVFPDFPVAYITTGAKQYAEPNVEQYVLSEDTTVYGTGNNKDSVSVEEHEAVKKELIASKKTIEALRKAIKVLTDSLCGDNPTLSDLGEK